MSTICSMMRSEARPCGNQWTTPRITAEEEQVKGLSSPSPCVDGMRYGRTDKECTRRRSLLLAVSYRPQQHEWKDRKVPCQLRRRTSAQEHERVVENWRRCGNEILQYRSVCRCRNSRKQGRRNVFAQMPLPQQLALGTPQRRRVAKPQH